MEIVSNSQTTLRAIGKDERWIQDWLLQEPSRLGLGSVTIKAKEVRHYSGSPGLDDEDRAVNDESTWEARASEFTANARATYKICDEKIGPSRIDFGAKSYIALKKGNRAWLPMWPRKGGFYVYLPGGPGGSQDQPSDFYAKVKAALAELGQGEPTWSYNYNAGANPIDRGLNNRYGASRLNE
jgi:hypothetical protein